MVVLRYRILKVRSAEECFLWNLHISIYLEHFMKKKKFLMEFFKFLFYFSASKPIFTFEGNWTTYIAQQVRNMPLKNRTSSLCTIFMILLTLWNSEQKNRLFTKLFFCFSSDFDETWWSCSTPGFIKIRWKTKKFY